MSARRTPLATIARGAAVVLAGVIAASALGYAQKLVIANHLPPGGLGRVALGLAIVGLATAIATLGLREGLARFLAAHRDDARAARRILVYAFAIGAPLAGAASLALYAGADALATRAFHDPFLAPILRILAPLVLLGAVAQLAIAAFRGLAAPGAKALVADLLQPTVVLLLLVALLARGYGAEGGARAYAIAGAAMAAGALVGLALLIPRGDARPAGAVERVTARSLLAFSWPLMLTSVLWLVVAWTDVAMLGAMRASYEVGLYGVALPTAQLLLLPLNALAFLFMPTLSALHARGDVPEARRTFRHVTRWVFLATFPLWVLVVALADPLVSALFGEAYAPAAPALRILATGFLVAAVVGPTGNVLVALGRPKANLAFAATAAGLNVALNLALIPRWGHVGAAAATAVSVAVANAVSLALAHRAIGEHPFHRSLLAPVAAAAIAVVPALLLASRGTPGLVLAAVLAYAALYVAALVVLRAFEAEDADALDALAEGVPALAGPLRRAAGSLRRLVG